jgi:dihydrofolate reductase
MKNIVVAYDKNHAIGKNGELPWVGKIPADMKRFRDLTLGHSVIMGRKTFESLPESYRPLPGRQNIVLSLGKVAGEGFQVATSLDEAYALAEHEEVNVIGGGQIYDLAIDSVDRIYATQINTVVEDPDTYFPFILDNEWTQAEFVSLPPDGKNAYKHSFITYLRNHRNI